ncbi:MAG: hypothetical protein Q8P52_03100, partial [bacterium]|nr:hypothetical protein [bacterium]
LALGIMSLLAKAEVVVVPQTEVLSIKKTYTATGQDASAELSYEVLPISKSMSTKVTASGEKQVERKASGKIIVYNDFSSSEQKLVANTRFETPSGLIYRIKDPITVPGTNTVGGQTVPGSIETTVYADVSGAAYNSSLVDFTIPGFKNDPSGRYEKFYARSKTEMTGGFVGMEKLVSEEELLAARQSLQSSIEKSLLAEAKSQIPDGFIMFDKAYSISFSSKPLDDGGEGTATLTETGDIKVYLIKKVSLDRKILAESPEIKEPADNLTLRGTKDLTFNPITLPEGATGQFVFGLDGRVMAVWVFDEDELRNDLAGQSKNKMISLLPSYPVKSISGSLHPSWKKSFPTDPSKISVQIRVPDYATR